jgi:hypothetical protein
VSPGSHPGSRWVAIYRQGYYLYGMATRKTSVALGKDELVLAKKYAQARGLSLSAFLTGLIRAHVAQQARFAAMDAYTREHAPGFRLTQEARDAIEAEWNAPLKPVRTRRRRAAA